MLRSTFISALVHGAILLAAVVALPDPEEFEVKTSEAVPVEIVSEEDIKPKAEKKPPEPVKKVEPPKPEPKKEVAKLPPKPEPEPEPKPVEKPPEKEPVVEKPPEPEPEPTPEKTEAPKQLAKVYPKPKRKPKPPKRKKAPEPEKFDDTINALLNKLPDETPAPAPESTDDDAEKAASTSSVLQSGTEAERAEIAEIINAVMQRCWNPPIGAKDLQNLRVTFRLAFSPNGEFSRPPESTTSASDPVVRATIESARRALIRCGPYPLPADTYDVWKDVVANFHPGAMF